MDNNLKFLLLDSEVRSWFVTEASNLRPWDETRLTVEALRGVPQFHIQPHDHHPAVKEDGVLTHRLKTSKSQLGVSVWREKPVGDFHRT